MTVNVSAVKAPHCSTATERQKKNQTLNLNLFWCWYKAASSGNAKRYSGVTPLTPAAKASHMFHSANSKH